MLKAFNWTKSALCNMLLEVKHFPSQVFQGDQWNYILICLLQSRELLCALLAGFSSEHTRY